MKLSQKAEYALRALVVLASEQGPAGRAVRLQSIAKREGIPEKFLEAIMVELKRAGMVQSLRGPEGGHRLARPSAQIRVGEVWRAIDGSLALDVSDPQAAPSPAAQALRRVWQDVERAVTMVVDNVTVADLWKSSLALGDTSDYDI